MYDHEKRLGKSSQQPKNEEKKGDGESDQGGAGKRDGVPPVGVPVDADLSGGDDAVNGGNAIQSPTVKSPDQPQMADIDTLNHWVEGHDDEGFTEYGVLWGITKPGAITDLIKSHIRKIQSDGYKGSRSAANDDRNSADVHYKQRQEQAAAEAKRAVNAPDDHSPPDFNDDEEF